MAADRPSASDDPAPSAGEATTDRPGAGIPVVLVHGALRSRVGWWPTAQWLRRRGFSTRAFGYPTRHGTLADHGRALGAFVRDWLGESPPPVLGFLTHSMGGLVVRAWLAQAAPTQLGPCQRIVMLSPPNRGSTLARKHRENPMFHWLYGDAARELASDVPRSLPPLPATAQALVLGGGTGGGGINAFIHGDDDGVVAVADMPLDGAGFELLGGWHAVLQWSPRFLRRAASFLAQQPGSQEPS